MVKRILMLGSSQSGENNIKRRREVCQRIAEPDTVVESLNTETMPDLVIPRIGNFIDEYLCAVQVFKIVAREQKNFDGIVIAGFADTGLDGAREIAEIPILGIAETPLGTTEGQVVNLDDIRVSRQAQELAERYEIHAAVAQLVIDEADEILGEIPHVLLTIKNNTLESRIK